MTASVAVDSKGPWNLWRRRASMVGATLVGLAAIGAAAMSPLLGNSIDLLMHPKCPSSIRLSLVGIDLSVALVAFVSMHLARSALRRGGSSVPVTGRLWMGAGSLWLGTAGMVIYLASHLTWPAVFDGWCTL